MLRDCYPLYNFFFAVGSLRQQLQHQRHNRHNRHNYHHHNTMDFINVIDINIFYYVQLQQTQRGRWESQRCFCSSCAADRRSVGRLVGRSSRERLMQSTFDNSSFGKLVKWYKAAHKLCTVEKIKI